MKKSILLSLMTFIVSFFIILIVLYILKPSFLLYIETNEKKIIDNYKLYLISVLCSLLISILMFLYIQKPIKPKSISKSNFSFEYDPKSINENIIHKNHEIKLNSNQIIV